MSIPTGEIGSPKIQVEEGKPGEPSAPFADGKAGWWTKMDAGFMNDTPAGGAVDQKKPGGFTPQYNIAGLKSNYGSLFSKTETPASPTSLSQPASVEQPPIEKPTAPPVVSSPVAVTEQASLIDFDDEPKQQLPTESSPKKEVEPAADGSVTTNAPSAPFADGKAGWWNKMDAGYMNDVAATDKVDPKKPGGFVPQYNVAGLKSNYGSLFGDKQSLGSPTSSGLTGPSDQSATVAPAVAGTTQAVKEWDPFA